MRRTTYCAADDCPGVRYCKPCRAIYQHEYDELHREQINEYRRNNKPLINAIARRSYHKNKKRVDQASRFTASVNHA